MNSFCEMIDIDNGFPDYSDSVIENDPVNMSTVSEDSCKFELFEELTQVRKSHPRKLITHFLTDMHGICFSSVKPAEGNLNAAYEAFESQISNKQAYPSTACLSEEEEIPRHE